MTTDAWLLLLAETQRQRDEAQNVAHHLCDVLNIVKWQIYPFLPGSNKEKGEHPVYVLLQDEMNKARNSVPWHFHRYCLEQRIACQRAEIHRLSHQKADLARLLKEIEQLEARLDVLEQRKTEAMCPECKEGYLETICALCGHHVRKEDE